ncbi:hypothetical protein RSOLAG1IB_11498 [Rhizoctonia solani AG-1 IB]|uniref:Uncharacterized protein n=1 Tax=Thanatephorus cucumeris (strain AG1-IB / isolate 7/3/14) TaxID=1108050 RepID=A0A0B7F882_THACB|nr:hypothetical protein RSOLAG1IB_11498 [Rhizoctonia solani AG-1 IB]
MHPYFSTSHSPEKVLQGPKEDQIEFICRTQELLFAERLYLHPARVAYWHQLKESKPSDDCINLITLHLWLSVLLADPTQDILYIDPYLAHELAAAYHDDLLDIEADNLLHLYERHQLWPQMGSLVHVIVLLKPGNLIDNGGVNWVLLDMTVDSGQLTHMEVLLPPLETYNHEMFETVTSCIIGGLNAVLPRRSMIRHSSKVLHTFRQLLLPRPRDEEAITLAMIAHLCGKLLRQSVREIDTGVMRQSLCYFYNQALRSNIIDSSFPWPGLTNQQGVLLTDQAPGTVLHRRFSLAANRDPSPATEIFPRPRTWTATVAVPGPSAPFFVELGQPQTSHPPGILVGTSGRSTAELEKAALLGDYPSFRRRMPDAKLQIPEALSLDEFVALNHSLGGPTDSRAQRMLLTMVHGDEPLTLDWLKDAYDIQLEWLLAGWDLDSLSATFFEVPEFLRAGSYYPYPSRALSLTNRNELVVRINGKDIDMHSCPNICIMSFGANNQFRLLVFFPEKRDQNPRNRNWRNIPTEIEMQDWYHIFLTALHMVAASAPHDWEHAFEKTIEALPDSYAMAQNQATKAGGPRSFVGHRIEPTILNATFPVIRRIVDTTPQYAQYRSYFFHLCGINLKLATMNVHGREDANPMNYSFRVNDFVDWYKLNPNDIVADVGLAINIHRRSVPEELKRSTLLWRHDPVRELLRPAFRTPQRDSYCHSHVIAGLRANARSSARDGGVIKIQVYNKDMVLTYRHKDSSIGANFTTNESILLGNRDKFDSQMKAFQAIMQEAGTYGLRLEERLTAWGANQLMQRNPRHVLERLVVAEALVAYPTATIAGFKLMLSKTWSGIIYRQQQLSLRARRSPEVLLLTSAVAYFLKGLVKRPDEMSPSRDMVDRLALVQGANTYGLPCLHADLLDESNLRVAYNIQAETFKILNHCNVIYPGGNRIKSSCSRGPGLLPPPHVPTPPATPIQVTKSTTLWSNSSQAFLNRLLKIELPRMLWSMFRDSDKAPGGAVAELRIRPLRQKDWAKVVEPLNTLHLVKGKFVQSLETLFPPNWTINAPQGDFKRYDQDFLQLIRNHVDSVSMGSRSLYSAELRRKIWAFVMDQYDYLPSMHAHKIWTTQPSNTAGRVYRICSRV